MLPESGVIQLQLIVTAPDDSGNRGISVHSCPDSAETGETAWTRHATGVLGQPTG